VSKVKYWQAINRALEDALAADDEVILFGEDVAGPGGSFGATRGLQKRFGPSRVRDTPISEATLVGSALGAAMTGLRPVVEIMFMDFTLLTMDQLVNQAAKISYMSGGKYSAPLVMRTVCGAGRETGPQHGQTLDFLFANVPGLKVVWPSDPSDAYWLLRQSIEDDDPVVFVESLNQWAAKGEIEAATNVPEFGSARVVRGGSDVTVIAWGAATSRARQAADRAAEQGVSAEIVDLRSLSPIDWPTVHESVARTRRALVVQDAAGTDGLAASISASIHGELFGELHAPVARLAPPFAPVPFAPRLEEHYFVSSSAMAEELVRLAETSQRTYPGRKSP
jgi:acetoin:2,6-dichlorophenolindophenol oxidoreductase subunit beta